MVVEVENSSFLKLLNYVYYKLIYGRSSMRGRISISCCVILRNRIISQNREILIDKILLEMDG